LKQFSKKSRPVDIVDRFDECPGAARMGIRRNRKEQFFKRDLEQAGIT